MIERIGTRAELLAQRERWRLVRERQRDELLALSMAEKFERLEALVSSALVLGWGDRGRDENHEMDRWVRLRELLSG
jgi:hypothetical protein